MKWLYDNEEHVYRKDVDDDDEALVIGLLLLLLLRDDLSATLQAEAVELAQKLAQGEMTVQQFTLAMRDLLERGYVEQYALGKGGTNNLFAGDMAVLAGLLAAQYGYLQNFAQQIAAGKLSAEQVAARVKLYMSSSTQAFEQGQSAAYGRLVLPAYPGDGQTQCRCITTPDSRVLTQNGWKPLMDVEIGEMVLTHRLRWRRVTAKIVKPSQPEHRQVYIRSAGGRWVGATDTHRWYTSRGWENSKDIDSNGGMVYNLRRTFVHDWDGEPLYEAILQPMRCRVIEPEFAGGVPEVPLVLSLWEQEGYASRSVQVLRDEPEGDRSMGRQGTGSKATGGGADSSQTTANYICGPELGHPMAGKVGREAILLCLGRRQTEDNLPLPVGMDNGQRADTKGISHPSYQPRQGRRQIRESGANESQSSRSVARGNDPRCNVGNLSRDGVRFLRRDIPASPTGGEKRSFLQPGLLSQPPANEGVAEILFTGTMPIGTPLYDLTVEEDHSFVIEGLFAHNSNCKCNWRIEEYEDRWECFWELNPADHCADCIENNLRWSPLVVTKVLVNSLADVERFLSGAARGGPHGIA